MNSVQKTGLPPVIDERTQVLILGTLPSDKSLAAEQYYANPSNDFWKLIGATLDEKLNGVPYDRRVQILKARGIGLWDAFRICVRSGSMDKYIAGQELNDFAVLRSIAPNLRLVCFNGKSAAEAEATLRVLGYDTKVLPSSSAANRRDQSGRLARWKSVLR